MWFNNMKKIKIKKEELDIEIARITLVCDFALAILAVGFVIIGFVFNYLLLGYSLLSMASSSTSSAIAALSLPSNYSNITKSTINTHLLVINSTTSIIKDLPSYIHWAIILGGAFIIIGTITFWVYEHKLNNLKSKV